MEMKIRKMPPLPKRKQPGELNIEKLPMMGVHSTRINISHQYNSVEKRKDLSKENYKQNQRNQNQQNLRVLLHDKYCSRPSSVKSLSKERNSITKSRQSSRGSEQKYKNRVSPHYNIRMRMSVPQITAKSWIVFEMKSKRYIYGKQNVKKREIASLTKIMTLLTILEILKDYDLQSRKIRVTICKEAANIGGTTAELQPNIELTLENLFYAMMLPSGNDAAYMISIIGGTILHLIQNHPHYQSICYSPNNFHSAITSLTNASYIFIQEMNRKAQTLEMYRTNWVNSHGLSNSNNYSTAEDMAKLCMHAMKIQIFRDVVNTQSYSCPYYYEIPQEEDTQLKINQNKIEKRIFTWENTNKLLNEGWNGLKTGVTPNAGPCLAATINQSVNGRSFEFLVVLINSFSMEIRWKEAKQLVQWVLEQNSFIF